MKLLDLLRKLGVIRYGTKAATFTSGRDRPIELMDAGVFNAAKEITTRQDVKALFGSAPAGQPPPIPVPARCPRCGTPASAPWKYCTGCGASLQAPALPVVAQPPAFAPVRKNTALPLVLVVIGMAGFLAVLLWVAVHKLGQGGKGVPATSAVQPVPEVSRVAPSARPMQMVSPVMPKADSSALPPNRTTGQVSGMKYDLYRNPKFGFVTELPAHWESKVKNNAHVFSGPQGSEEYQTTINFQIIQRQGQTARSQAEELVAQWRKMEGFELLDQKQGECFGQPCWLLMVRYKLSAGEIFQQQQLVIEREPYFYLIAFTAPPDLFLKYGFVMTHLMETFKFTVPVAAGQ